MAVISKNVLMCSVQTLNPLVYSDTYSVVRLSLIGAASCFVAIIIYLLLNLSELELYGEKAMLEMIRKPVYHPINNQIKSIEPNETTKATVVETKQIIPKNKPLYKSSKKVLPRGKMTIHKHKQSQGQLNNEISAVLTSLIGKSPAVMEQTLLDLKSRKIVNDELNITLALMYSHTGQWEKANQAYKAVCETTYENEICLYNLAISYDHLGNYSSAIDYYKASLIQGIANNKPLLLKNVRARISSISKIKE
jgi:tetratricopeptide (TPR) repeat protein